MRLIDDWKRKFPKLWSVQLSILAALASAVEVGFSYWATGKPAWIAGAAMLISLGAAGARIIAQPSVTANG
ncbi:hypothetical protein K32_49480 [Kaistia sp. 32K]|uniref:DUF7940 domain-containing protein n=1 Tax=Kaistia sp. 32K TaxID=2795690 RepID=UPI0019158E7D|nr:hypothetical protein [Kaistia sp. 32K]BCP56331.1 hypothetical protein K32_49480 [Kaistia sp. 32K]